MRWPIRASRHRGPRDDFVKTVKRKAKSAALVWKDFRLTAGYHSHTAPAAKGRYCITPTFEREEFNGYLVSQVDGCDARYLCGKPGHGGTKTLDDAKAIAQVITTPDGIGLRPSDASRRGTKLALIQINDSSSLRCSLSILGKGVPHVRL
jgi:hypothetical protein